MSSMNGSGVDPQALREQQLRQQACLDSAIFAGLKASATSLVISGGLVAGLVKFSDFFRSHFTVGAKTSFLMLPTFYSFWWASEKTVARCSAQGSRNRFKQSRQAYATQAPVPEAAAAAATPTAATVTSDK
eukprot:GHUV01005254.1.p2 GENE.GHUV01005254.1~~GHUV01005254.1.p2  ORF type:complete len:131 (+),score=51.39 GHUV01005254.1:401-793(+)